MELNDTNFHGEVYESDIPVLVEFWGSWCPPCKMMAPMIEKLEKEYVGRVKIRKLNVDRNRIASGGFQIRGVPAFFLFQEGKITHQEFGAQTEKQLRKLVERAMPVEDGVES
jgi:thioredoxin 1